MKILTKASDILKQLEKHHVNEYAVQCAYYIVLSFIPFLILLFSLVQFTNIGQDIIFFLVEDIFPGTVNEFIEDVIREASFKSIGTLSISVVFLVWSAGSGFFALCKGFHYIYETPKEYNYWFLKFKAVICMIVFIIMIVAVLLLATFGRTIVNFLRNEFTSLSSTINFIINWRALWQIVLLFFVFWLMYRFVPNYKVKFKTQIPGAIFSAVGWYVLSWGFSLYLNVFKNFSIIYGSLTSIMLLMIWIYWCMYVLLLGAEINVLMDKRKKRFKINRFFLY